MSSAVTDTPPYLVIVSGPPGTGKTTLAQRLAARLKLPLMTKDMIKESLFESLGWSDRDWSKQLSRASIALLFQFAEAMVAAGASCIVESNFSSTLAAADFRAIQARYPFVPIQVQCWTEPAVLVERLRRRSVSGERHPGHLEAMTAPLLSVDTVTWRSEPIDIGGTMFEVDTTRLETVDYEGLMAQIAAMIPP